MKLILSNLMIKIALATALTGSALAEGESFDEELKLEPLSHLIKSIEDLRSKKIPQAYFLLQSPNVTNDAVFFPDTKGGAYILIGRLDKPSEKASWLHLKKVLKPWAVPPKGIKHLADSNPFWTIREGDLVVKIPTQNTKVFYAALMKAWKTNKKDFKCFANWN